MSDQAYQASLHISQMEKLMDPCRAKTELEHAAAREVKDLRDRLAELEPRVRRDEGLVSKYKRQVAKLEAELNRLSLLEPQSDGG